MSQTLSLRYVHSIEAFQADSLFFDPSTHLLYFTYQKEQVLSPVFIKYENYIAIMNVDEGRILHQAPFIEKYYNENKSGNAIVPNPSNKMRVYIQQGNKSTLLIDCCSGKEIWRMDETSGLVYNRKRNEVYLSGSILCDDPDWNNSFLLINSNHATSCKLIDDNETIYENLTNDNSKLEIKKINQDKQVIYRLSKNPYSIAVDLNLDFLFMADSDQITCYKISNNEMIMKFEHAFGTVLNALEINTEKRHLYLTSDSMIHCLEYGYFTPQQIDSNFQNLLIEQERIDKRSKELITRYHTASFNMGIYRDPQWAYNGMNEREKKIYQMELKWSCLKRKKQEIQVPSQQQPQQQVVSTVSQVTPSYQQQVSTNYQNGTNQSVPVQQQQQQQVTPQQQQQQTASSNIGNLNPMEVLDCCTIL